MRFSLSVITLILSFSFSSYSQPIVYQVPRSTERKVADWIQTLPREFQDSVCFQMGNHSPESRGYYIACTTLSDDSWSVIARQSNRFLQIQSHYYPVVLDYDDAYALTKDQSLSLPGSAGHMDGLIMRHAVLFHGKIIHFKAKRRIRNTIQINEIPVFSRTDSTKIVYYLNDEISTKSNNLPERLWHQLYVRLTKMDGKIWLYFYIGMPEWEIGRTNRYILFDDGLFPLYFDYDQFFSPEFSFQNVLFRLPQNIIEWDPKDRSVVFHSIIY